MGAAYPWQSWRGPLRMNFNDSSDAFLGISMIIGGRLYIILVYVKFHMIWEIGNCHHIEMSGKSIIYLKRIFKKTY